MHRLVSLKLASKLSKTSLSRPIDISQPFTSLPKSLQTHFVSRPWLSRSQTTASPMARAFVSRTLSTHFPNALLPKKGFSGLGLAFRGLQLPKRGFNIDSSLRSYTRDWRSWLRNLSPNDFIIGLIVTNVGVFMLWRIAGANFMYNNFTISVENLTRGRLHTLITSAFSHKDLENIIHNMIGLYFFGIHIGQVFGTEFLLKLYLAGGLAGSVLYLVHSAYLASSFKGQAWKDPLRTPGLGASGAVNAIILLDIFLHPRNTLYLNFFIPVPAILLGIYLIGKDFLGTIEGNTPGSAHLGGAVVAAIVWARIRRGRF